MQAAKGDRPRVQNARNTDAGESFNSVLFSALSALEQGKIAYGLIGGVAASGFGRPRSTRDIDIFVRSEDAGSALEALGRHGFRTERTDPSWLFKAFKDGILVDIIFKSRGDIYFDREMAERTALIAYHGTKVRMVSPEDLVIIKCVVHDEIGPHHWHDALAILSHATLDWEYLLKRARRAPRRLLALLTYAQSNDIGIPNRIIFELFRFVYGDVAPEPRKHSLRVAPATDPYIAAHVKAALSRDERTGEQDIAVLVEGTRIILRGEVGSQERRQAIEDVARDAAPGHQIQNQIAVAVLKGPEGTESVG